VYVWVFVRARLCVHMCVRVLCVIFFERALSDWIWGALRVPVGCQVSLAYLSWS